MAKTKFLDYTGLAKLVEKIKNTYVNKNEQYEANLKWGGGNFADSCSPIDAAMIPELGANRFAFGDPKGITIEYSNDGGNTWKDYGADPVAKGRLLSDGYSFIIGKVKSSTPANDMLRITIDTSTETGINCYTTLKKFVIKISTQGSVGCYCTIQMALQSTPTKFLNVVSKVNINGWSGCNVINVPTITTYGNKENSQYGRLRFIFGSTGNDTSYSGLAIHNIWAFGGIGWSTPSNMAANGHLYGYDYNQNAIFPANVTATNFIGTLQGNANSASKLGTATVGGATKPMYLNGGTPTECTYTLAQSVTSTSKLTDHLYNAGEGLMLTTGTTADTFSLSAATSSTIGGVKIGNNISITSGTISLTKANVTTALGYTPPTADTNTHYTTGLIVGNSSSSTGNTAVTTNGVFLNLKDDNHIRNSHKIVGGGATTVTSDSGGTITIHSTDTIYTLSRNVNNHAKISLTSVNGSDDITIDNVENAGTATRLSTSTAGSETQPVYFDGGIPKPLKYTIEKSVPSDAVFTDDSVSQRIYNRYGIPDLYERPLLIGQSIIEDGTVNSTIGETFVTSRITASITKGTITASGGFIGEATSARKLSVDGGKNSTNGVLVVGNYSAGTTINGNAIPGNFTPSGIVSMITDPDIENEIKKPIVWPTA